MCRAAPGGQKWGGGSHTGQPSTRIALRRHENASFDTEPPKESQLVQAPRTPDAPHQSGAAPSGRNPTLKPMPCIYPMRAWRTPEGIRLAKEKADGLPMHLPCGRCIECRKAKAKAWALRCSLELQNHNHAVFTTLTYETKRLPPSLQKPDLQIWIRKLRKDLGPNRPVRFFACGEYGEQNGRPHYHAILYGAHVGDRERIENAWGKGRTQTEEITARRIAYCAGYTQKKFGAFPEKNTEWVDADTGEVYEYQAPFLQMSRRPGIAATARDEHKNMWRLFAIHDGQRQPVPRFLHEAWKKAATPQELEALIEEKIQYKKQQLKNTNTGGRLDPPDPLSQQAPAGPGPSGDQQEQQKQQRRAAKAERQKKQQQQQDNHRAAIEKIEQVRTQRIAESRRA